MKQGGKVVGGAAQVASSVKVSSWGKAAGTGKGAGPGCMSTCRGTAGFARTRRPRLSSSCSALSDRRAVSCCRASAAPAKKRSVSARSCGSRVMASSRGCGTSWVLQLSCCSRRRLARAAGVLPGSPHRCPGSATSSLRGRNGASIQHPLDGSGCLMRSTGAVNNPLAPTCEAPEGLDGRARQRARGLQVQRNQHAGVQQVQEVNQLPAAGHTESVDLAAVAHGQLLHQAAHARQQAVLGGAPVGAARPQAGASVASKDAEVEGVGAPAAGRAEQQAAPALADAGGRCAVERRGRRGWQLAVGQGAAAALAAGRSCAEQEPAPWTSLQGCTRSGPAPPVDCHTHRSPRSSSSASTVASSSSGNPRMLRGRAMASWGGGVGCV